MDQPTPREPGRIARSGVGRPGYVTVKGAREHNLRDVDVELPRDALVVFTGVSGSGKSSLAFGTLYAEAQRRYFESVADYEACTQDPDYQDHLVAMYEHLKPYDSYPREYLEVVLDEEGFSPA